MDLQISEEDIKDIKTIKTINIEDDDIDNPTQNNTKIPDIPITDLLPHLPVPDWAKIYPNHSRYVKVNTVGQTLKKPISQPHTYTLLTIRLKEVDIDTDIEYTNTHTVSLQDLTLNFIKDKVTNKNKNLGPVEVNLNNIVPANILTTTQEYSHVDEKTLNFLKKLANDGDTLDFKINILPTFYPVTSPHISDKERFIFTIFKNNQVWVKDSLTITPSQPQPFCIRSQLNDKNGCVCLTCEIKNANATFNCSFYYKNIPFKLNNIFLDDGRSNIPINSTPLLWKNAFKKKCGFDLTTCLQNINKDKTIAVVSGSFLIEKILDENWPDSDIDIFTTDADAVKQELKSDGNIQVIFNWKILGKNGEYENLSSASKKYLNLPPNLNQRRAIGYEDLRGIIKVYQARNHKCVIQIIHCDSIWKCINSFDTETCMNTFDGQNLRIKNESHLFSKTMHMNNSTPKRIEKYRKRGFNIKESKSPLLVTNRLYP